MKLRKKMSFKRKIKKAFKETGLNDRYFISDLNVEDFFMAMKGRENGVLLILSVEDSKVYGATSIPGEDESGFMILHQMMIDCFHNC